jgi:hypothetical protein
MSWDGLYMNERHYPVFEPGDEVCPISKFRSLTKGKGYIVIDCFTPYTRQSNAKMVKIKTDKGYIGEFSTYRFTKSERQIQIDKREEIINNILND